MRRLKKRREFLHYSIQGRVHLGPEYTRHANTMLHQRFFTATNPKIF